MGILKELLTINEEQLTEAAKKAPKKASKTARAPKAGEPIDATSQDAKDKPFMQKPKYPQFVPGNMWFNMTKSGPRAGEKK
jgi:hypothetical protein